jgi:hypothetical protein
MYVQNNLLVKTFSHFTYKFLHCPLNSCSSNDWTHSEAKRAYLCRTYGLKITLNLNSCVRGGDVGSSSYHGSASLKEQCSVEYVLKKSLL